MSDNVKRMGQPLREVIVVRTIAVLVFALLTFPVGAQTYPSRTIHFVSAFAPGGTTDILARILAEKLREQVGQPVIVENRPGAGGNIGSNSVAKAAPDGYTLLMGASGPLAVNVSLFATMPFDPRRDFVPVVQVTEAPLVLVVPAAPTSSPRRGSRTPSSTMDRPDPAHRSTLLRSCSSTWPRST